MINAGKCPKCEKLVSNVKIESVTASTSLFGGTKWNAISYVCMFCNTVLSVQIDPIAIKTDTLKALGKQ